MPLPDDLLLVPMTATVGEVLPQLDDYRYDWLIVTWAGRRTRYYVLSRLEAINHLFSEDPARTLDLALRLADRRPTPVVSPEEANDAQTMSLVMDGADILGVFLYIREGASSPPPPPPPPPPPRPAPTQPTRSAEAAAPEPKAFSAYPAISDPGPLQPAAAFKIAVGFSAALDETLSNVGQINIANPDEDAMLEVSLMAIGATIDNNRLKKLPLDMDAQVSFACQVQPGSAAVTVIAMYFYKQQPVGTATRVIPVAGAVAAVPAAPPAEAPKAGGCQLALTAAEGAAKLDMTLIVTRDGTRLKWKIIADLPRVDLDTETSVSDARAFAKKIDQELRKEKYKGQAARNALINLGESIADLMPAAFFEALQSVHDHLQRPPRLMIWTDEAYIPWELAYDRRLELDDEHPRFLSAQAITGRWWLHDRVVTPPPVQLDLKRFSAMAAEYSFGSKVKPLPEALKEKSWLADTFAATELPATRAGVLALTGGAPQAGHLIHIALHGMSDPAFDDQKLIFEDGELSPMAMIGEYNCGDVPAISFLFLNACQVGTAGGTLGQAGGFPGVLLKKGLLGFIAPLWEVHDVAARVLAETFYTEVLRNGRPVAEVLMDLRRRYDFEESLTPLAYLFYGHPGLTLTLPAV